MKNKTPDFVLPTTVLAAALMTLIGAWGVLNSFRTADIWKAIGGFHFPAINFAASKLYFSYGAFTIILTVSVFVLFSVFQKYETQKNKTKHA